MRQVSHETYMMTDDGSYGEQGLVTKKLNDLIAAVDEAGIIVEDVMAAPIAASLVTLNKAQKIAGGFG